MNIEQKLQRLREKMRAANIDYYYVPSADAHRNEYVPDCWQRRAWLTGFTGSAGDALVGQKDGYLWTDGRYFLQAEQQLDPHYFQLMKQHTKALSIEEWLVEQDKNLCLGVDSKLLTIRQQEQWNAALKKTNSTLVAIEENWIDTLWKDQPAFPNAPAFPLEIQYTGCETQKKLNDLRDSLKQHKADTLIITQLDAIAWLLNIRGHDVMYNPLVISYVIVTLKTVTLFIDPNKITQETKQYFDAQHITLKPYDAFGPALNALKAVVLLDPNGCSWWTLAQLKHALLVFAPSPITLMKAVKNTVEQQGMREAHRIDAIAMVTFLHWIEQHWREGITERSAANVLEALRRKDSRCKDLSFSTISGFASNGAIIHYFAEPETDKTIDDSALYLLDSGGQYFEGTTDVTRTIHLGEPTAKEKRHYTLVLKGHLALRHTTFPPGTCGEELDLQARKFLQAAGYDYAHGTGHGVGCYLCVHEGPQGISPRKTGVPLQPGMIVSNEPGLYLEGHYGIRIENVCLVCQVNEQTYMLDDLTLVPYARKLFDMDLLNSTEIEWINRYHREINKKIAPSLSQAVAEWLNEATKPL